jgi:hypothetical protein
VLFMLGGVCRADSRRGAASGVHGACCLLGHDFSSINGVAYAEVATKKYPIIIALVTAGL